VVLVLRSLVLFRFDASGGAVRGPWSAARAASRSVPADSAQVSRVLRQPERLRAHALPQPDQPQVSVIIPVRDRVEYTIACLLSIALNPPAIAYEVIVVDDASSDRTAAVLAGWPGLRVVHNAENLGFIGACNRGAAVARGQFLCFLNNDTNVLHGWLDELCRTFQELTGVGLVGSKLVYPSGRLQEAGGIVWRDGSAWNYGHLDDPDHPRASYLRDVDYVSGASLLVSKADFDALGGFDAHFAPAYYEDSDFAFRIRQAGKRVVVQPASLVVHEEGVSGGRSPGAAVKRHQSANREKFVERWQDVLERHRRNGDAPELEKERRIAQRLLMIDAHTPCPDRDAGSVTADHYARIFQALGYKVTLAPHDLQFSGEYTIRLQRRGIECLYHPFDRDLTQVLKRRAREFDLAFVSRPYVAARVLPALRRFCPKTKVIYNAVDLHFLREARQAELEGNPALARHALGSRREELSIVAAADCTIVLSEAERRLLCEALPGARVEVIALIHEEEAASAPHAGRSGMIFIGGAQHPPNPDAVQHFVRDIMPAMRAQGGSQVLSVIGSQSPTVQGLDCQDVHVLGHVADLGPHFQRALCMVVPVRFGAGVKGKIGTAFAFGLPVISTPLGVEGMDLVEGRDYLAADTPAQWVGQIGRLREDRALWQSLSEAGRRIVRERYSPARVADRLRVLIPTL